MLPAQNNPSPVDQDGGMPLRELSGRVGVAGLFEDRETALQAVHDLKAAGFRPDQIGIAISNPGEETGLAEEADTHVGKGAVIGVVGGGLLGALAGFLVAIGSVALPGIGPVVAGGALATALGAAGSSAVSGAEFGAVAGGVVGALIGLGVPEEQAHHFEQGLRDGKVLVTVRTNRRAGEAWAILERHGADTGPGSLGEFVSDERPGAETGVGFVDIEDIGGIGRGQSVPHRHTSDVPHDKGEVEEHRPLDSKGRGKGVGVYEDTPEPAVAGEDGTYMGRPEGTQRDLNQAGAGKSDTRSGENQVDRAENDNRGQ